LYYNANYVTLLWVVFYAIAFFWEAALCKPLFCTLFMDWFCKYIYPDTESSSAQRGNIFIKVCSYSSKMLGLQCAALSVEHKKLQCGCERNKTKYKGF